MNSFWYFRAYRRRNPTGLLSPLHPKIHKNYFITGAEQFLASGFRSIRGKAAVNTCRIHEDFDEE